MKSQTRVVVIGGGIAGCSTLYHLTREGWNDVVLLERDEITSGTTWHSAAQVTNFGMNQTMIALKSHSIALYKELAEDPLHPINYHHADGGIRLTNTPAQMDGYRHFASMAKGMGVDFEIIDAQECARRHPLITTTNLLGGLWDPLDGDIDPAQLCQALLHRARASGAEVHRHTPVTALTRHKDDSWSVHTDKGDIRSDIVVNASGYRVNEIAAMMGVQHPVVSMEHQYMLTEPIRAIAEAGHRMPLLRCAISDYYCRQEKQGLLIGFYEQGCKTWGMNGIDPDFSNALCPDDIERISDVWEGALERMPVLGEAGIHRVINGPITYSLDGAPLVGPVPGKRHAFCIVGLRAGLGEGGGHGWLLAQQIVHGEACYDTWPLDPRRFADHATVELCALKAREEYRNEFRFEYPHEHRPAGRPVKTTPLTSLLAAEGACFAVVNGWERADYYKPNANFSETHGFRFNEVFDVVAKEVAACSAAVGLAEVNGFNRIEFRGRDSLAFLDRMSCSRLPKRLGKVSLNYLLNHQGMIKAEATLAHLPDGRIWYGSAAAAQVHDKDWIEQHVHLGEQVALRCLVDTHTILVLAGPRARDVLQEVSRADWSSAAFPMLCAREAFIGIVPAVVLSVSFSGELAYELHVPNEQLQAAYFALREAGEKFGMRLFGARAIDSMRMEKGYLHWKAELLTEFDPFETGLAHLVDLEKENFIGRQALLERRGRGARKQLAMLEIDSADAPAYGGASVLAQGHVVGTATSGAWGHRVEKNLAYAFLDSRFSALGYNLELDLLGNIIPARVIPAVSYDPERQRTRS